MTDREGGMHLCACICVSVCMHMCLCVCVCVCVCVHACTHVYVCMCGGGRVGLRLSVMHACVRCGAVG
jgi:hypothetical protein